MSEGFVLWFTGLPSSGKTTLARIMANKLRDFGMKVELRATKILHYLAEHNYLKIPQPI